MANNTAVRTNGPIFLQKLDLPDAIVEILVLINISVDLNKVEICNYCCFSSFKTRENILSMGGKGSIYKI